MATDVLDEHRFTSQISLYQPPRTRLAKDGKHRASAGSTTTLYETASTSSGSRSRRLRYATQSSAPISTASTPPSHTRHSSSNDFISLFRSLAMKPFKTSLATNVGSEGQSNNIIGGSATHSRPPVSLLKYRPLSDSVAERSPYVQSTRVCIRTRPAKSRERAGVRTCSSDHTVDDCKHDCAVAICSDSFEHRRLASQS